MKLIHTLAIAGLAFSLSACIIAPPRPPMVYEPAPAPVAVAPVQVAPYPYYAMPAPGYFWVNHLNFGWGWRHPHHGWHRGWR